MSDSDRVYGQFDPPKSLSELVRERPRRPGSLSSWMIDIVGTAAHERNQRRAARVLKYPDLREALTEPPLSIPLRLVDEWSGYVPPARWPMDGPRNDSPSYNALRVIVDEANRRDREAGLDVDDPTADELIERHPFPRPGMHRGPHFYAGLPAEAARQQRAIVGGQQMIDPFDDEPASGERADFQHSPMRGPGRQ